MALANRFFGALQEFGMTHNVVNIETTIVNSGPAHNLPISVVMVSYMTGPALMEAIQAVLQDDDIFELMIVDNGNTESARTRLSSFIQDHDRVRVLQGHGNIGFARGCNYGAHLARGHYILFLNPDAIISGGSARALAKAGGALNTPWIAGGLLRDVNGQEQRGARRGALTPFSAFLGFTALHKVFGRPSIHQENTPMPTGPVKIQTISGACLMMDRPSFNALGGFDEAYFLHVEDIDICRRARLAGGDVCFVPHATAMHYGSTSKVHRLKIEHEKLKGFIRYFWNYKAGLMPKILTALMTPFMAFAILGRAVFLIIRQAIMGR